MLVANAWELRSIYVGTNKTDRVDAVKLARLARVDPALLKPIEHRGEQAQADLAVVAARELQKKKRAIVAMARKLAVLLHRLLTTGEVYEPLRPTARQTVATAA